MHSCFRQIHLYSAFVLMAFIVMYFVTGYVLTRGSLFGKASVTTTQRTVPVNSALLSAKSDEAAFATALQEQLGVSGKRSPAKRRDDGSWRFTFFHPGHQTEVTLAADLKSASIAEKHFDWQGALVGFHRLHGYGGGWLYDLWAVLYDLASGAMIVFAVSGVVLWHRLARPRWPGWVVLACGLAFTASTLSYLLWRR